MGEYDTGTMGGVAASAGAPAGRNEGLRGGIRAQKEGPGLLQDPKKYYVTARACRARIGATDGAFFI